MTIQIRERLKYSGKEYLFKGYPLDTLLEALDEKFEPQWSSCWRGYVGSWLIEDNRLFIEECKVSDGNCSLEDLLGYSFTKLEAKWFTGEIEIQEGDEISNCSIGGAELEFSYFLTFEKGKLIRQRKISNKTGKEIIISSAYQLLPRRDGVYLHHFRGNNRFGEYFEMTMMLVFTNENLVYYEDSDRIIEGVDFNSSLLDQDFGNQLSKNLGKYYIIENDRIKIRLPFSDNKVKFLTDEYQEFKGTIFTDHLNVDYSLRSWSEMSEKYMFRTLIPNARFDFYKLKK